jgi:hypothetical protein
LLAGLDGIQNKLSPGGPLDKDIYSLSPEELKDVPSMPAGLDQALDNLKNDHVQPVEPLVAYAVHPERFVRKPPQPPALPTEVWINLPPKPESGPSNSEKNAH